MYWAQLQSEAGGYPQDTQTTMQCLIYSHNSSELCVCVCGGVCACLSPKGKKTCDAVFPFLIRAFCSVLIFTLTVSASVEIQFVSMVYGSYTVQQPAV